MTVNERIKAVRKTNGLTLEKFGDKIGIKKTSLSQIETGRSNPSTQTLKSICREFGINEVWLRDGVGPMEAEEPTGSLDEYVQQYGASELELEFIRLYLSLPQDVRATVIEHFRAGLMNRIETLLPETPEERHERHKREARAEAEEYYQEVLAEKTAEENAQVSEGQGGAIA